VTRMESPLPLRILLWTGLLCLALPLLSCSSPHSSAAPPQKEQPLEVAKQNDWQPYLNARFGYSICYPADLLVPQGEAENGDGQKFLSKDSRAQMLVYGSNNALNQTVASSYSDELKAEAKAGFNITYKLLKPDYFVLSGSGSGKIFYERVVLVGDVFKTFRMEYPEDTKALFDPITSTMSGCFNPSLKTETSK
jgi:hypothetical protein